MQNVILISPATPSSPGLSRAQKFRRPGGTGEESRQFSHHCYYIKNVVQFDWLRVEVFQLNLKYLHVKITNHLRVVV